MSGESQILEKLVLQRDRARFERDQYLSIIRMLVALEDGPRSVHHDRARTQAVEAAREVAGDSFGRVSSA
jgi:hypothetical protein